MKAHKNRMFLCILLAAVLFAAALAPAAQAVVPQRPENRYVLDSAGVLSSATEQKIVSGNQKLFDEYGAEVVVVAVDFFGGKDREDYANELFNDWGIGSVERNNGILLLLGIGEDDYYAQAGSGIEDYFDGGMLGDLLYDYLEEDFAAGDYDSGVLKFFNAVVDELQSYYGDAAGSYEDAGGTGNHYEPDSYYEPEESGLLRGGLWAIGRVIAFLVRVIIVIVVILLVLALLRNHSGRGPGGGGGGFWQGMFLASLLSRRRPRPWGPPPPPPPRPGPGPGFGPRPGGFGGAPKPPGGFGGRPGGFSSGGRSGSSGAGRGSFGGGRSSGGFHSGGSSRGGGAGRR